jgi:2-polyprenyl-6-hydroxyphenyl methylase/3-demethylubiquinone-9 3-methyltransferase
MIDSLKPVSPTPLPCRICGSATALYGVVDFNKCGVEDRGFRLPLSGVPVYYRRCAACSFLFTDAFDDWNDGQFKAHIYNEGYGSVDPDYKQTRPQANADAVTRMWSASKTDMRILDFGGGNDAFCATLRANGFPVAVTYDPMVPEHAHRPDGAFDLVTCFETLEHLPDPAAGINLILECLAEPGLVLFSTLVQPPDFDTRGLNWWYVAPRNGHVSIFSKQALTAAWGMHGYKLVSLSDNAHVAFRTLPAFASVAFK